MKICKLCQKEHADNEEHIPGKDGVCASVVTRDDNVVRAAGTSEGAKKGWEAKHENHLGLSNIYSKHAAAFTMSAQAHEASAEAARTKSSDWHDMAFERHSKARRMHEELGNNQDAERHRQMANEHLNAPSKAKASDTTSTDVIHCRASSAAGEKLGASEPWKPGEQVSFMWMPAGVSTICAGFRKGSIELTVNCDEATAEAVQASLENWRNERPKQEPFGCVEHREQEASFRISASGGFKWNGDGVYLAAEPTTLGAQNVNGKVHRSWSPSFTTDADYSKAVERDGVLQFPEGVRGSRSNPARITGVDFCVGTLTNRPAFHSISPVKSREAVMAGAPEGNQNASGPHKLTVTRVGTGGHNVHSAVLRFHSKEAAQEHRDAYFKDTHSSIIEPLSEEEMKEAHAKARAASRGIKASEPITAHCKENLLRDVPDATKAEIAQYEKCIDEGGAHSDAVYEIRKERKNGFVSTAEKPTLDSIYNKVNASLTSANRLAEKNGACKLTAEDVYERHCVMAGAPLGNKNAARQKLHDKLMKYPQYQDHFRGLQLAKQNQDKDSISYHERQLDLLAQRIVSGGH